MRLANAIFAGSFAALAVLAAPTLAKNPEAQKAGDKATPAQCHAVEQTDDGQVISIPCQEIGAETRSRQRPSGASADAATR